MTETCRTATAPSSAERDWTCHAIALLEADMTRSADTHLIRVEFPALAGIPVYFKDESTHPTGSLKHRLARSLFLYGICNGSIRCGTTLVEASSGSTAVSEAYFAKMLGLPFVAVMPRSTSREKIAAIERQGGRCHLVEHAAEIYRTAQSVADEAGGHYLDQFTHAERATDWRGNNNIAESIFRQMSGEPQPVPDWVVMGAGTGGTSATIGRYIRYHKLATQLCVVDVEGSAFYDSWRTGDRTIISRGSRIEGIGRPRVEPSFIPGVIDGMLPVPDEASIAAARILSERLPHRVGASTGTNFVGVLTLAGDMQARARRGAIVTLICDNGDRYDTTYYDDIWLREQGLDISGWRKHIEAFLDTGVALPREFFTPLGEAFTPGFGRVDRQMPIPAGGSRPCPAPPTHPHA